MVVEIVRIMLQVILTSMSLKQVLESSLPQLKMALPWIPDKVTTVRPHLSVWLFIIKLTICEYVTQMIFKTSL